MSSFLTDGSIEYHTTGSERYQSSFLRTGKMTQKSLPSLFPPSFSNDGTNHGFRLRRDIHHRRLAWIIRDHSSDEQPSSLSDRITYPFPASSDDGIQTSCWNDIGIAGFQTVLNRQAHFMRRLIWLVVLTTCFTLMLLQTNDRLNYYLTRPVSTTVRFIRNDSLMFPSITLCPYRDTLTRDASHLDLAKLQSLYETHFPEVFEDPVEAMYKLADIYDVATLWKLSGWELETEIISCLQARVNCTENGGHMQRIFTILGYCLHYPGIPVTVAGHFFGFQIKMCKKDDTTDKINRFYMMISDRYSTHDIRALTHGFFLEQGWNKEVAVSLRHFQAENKHQAPCSPDESQTVSRCISRCFHETLIHKTGCRMPYMNLPNFTYSVPYCNTSEKLRLAEDLQKDLLWEGKGWHPASCHCENSSSCSQYLYETNSDTFARHDDCAQYKVYFTDMTYEETKEEFAYDIISLLCDIGGTLGLLLGASVLTMIQFVDALSRQIVKWLTKAPGLVKRQKSSSIFNVVQPLRELKPVNAS